jgi:cell division protein FtsW
MKLAVSTLVFCVAGLLALGLVMQYSSGMANSGAKYLVVQSVWCGIGLVFCFVAASLDYQILRRLAWPAFGVALILLALLLVPHLGIRRNGATRWLGYGKTSFFQPSEAAKIALILVLAWYAEHYQRQMPSWRRGILYPALIVAPILGLIYHQPDWGTTILLAAVSGIMLLVAGVRWRYVMPLAISAVAVLGYALWHNPVRRARIFSWLDLEANRNGGGYQVYQGILALGSGGWTGMGLGNGSQKLGFVPEHHTDFILPIIGEELGAIATLLVLAAFVAIFLCGLYIAVRSPDTFGTLLATGVTYLIGLQAFINVAVVTNVLPNKGLSLPFISYGGSNLLVMLTAVGFLLGIARRARPQEAVPGNEESANGMERDNPFRAVAATQTA